VISHLPVTNETSAGVSQPWRHKSLEMIFDVVHRQEHKPLMSMLPLLQCMHLLSKDVGPFVTYYRTYDDLINHTQRETMG